MRAHHGRQGPLRGVGPALLMAPAAFAVHQLRYYLAFGSAAGGELQRTGHSYLHSAAPWLVAVVAVACGCFLQALGRALSSHRSLRSYSISLFGLWLVCSVVLVGIFCAQEMLEGVFAAGHPPGLDGVFGWGGWWSIPAAACIGLVVATLLHGARWVLDELARVSSRELRTRSKGPGSMGRPVAAAVLRCAPLAEGWSGRGPPR